jgi:hypothetical protein
MATTNDDASPVLAPTRSILTEHGAMDIAIGATVACTYNSGSRYYKCTVNNYSVASRTAHVTFCDGYVWKTAPFSDLQPWVHVGDTARVVQGRKTVLVHVQEVRADGIVACPLKKNGDYSTEGSHFVPDMDVQPDKDTPLKVHQAALAEARQKQAATAGDAYSARAEVVEGVSRSGRRRTALQLRAPTEDEPASGRKRARATAAGERHDGRDREGDGDPEGVSEASDEDVGLESGRGAGSGQARKRSVAVREIEAEEDSDGEVLVHDSDEEQELGVDDDPDGCRKSLPDSVKHMPMADFCFQTVASFIVGLRAYNVSTATLCAFPRYVDPCMLHPYSVFQEHRAATGPLPDGDKETLLAAIQASKRRHIATCEEDKAPESPAAHAPREDDTAWEDEELVLPADIARVEAPAPAQVP